LQAREVSQTGLAAGLEFDSFQPADETRRDFRAELPIHIRVTGHFHEFGRFISGLAALSRIVTIHDIDISARQGEHDVFAVLVLMVLVACGDDTMTDLAEYVQRVKGRSPGPIDPLPAIEPIDSFSFVPDN